MSRKSSNVTHSSDLVWWGEYTVPENTMGSFRIGPALFRISRHPGEWRIVYEIDENAAENEVMIDLPSPFPDQFGRNAVINRFGISSAVDTIKLSTALPNRPVVIQSEMPFHIMPDQNISFYVSTPLWVVFHTGKPQAMMTEMPLFRPSDTWFGTTTIEGELCYASTTAGRLRLEDVNFRPHRAVTVVLIRNGTHNPVLLKSLNLPVPLLSLYESEDGYLWTQPVNLDLTENTGAAELSIKQRAPSEANKAKLICEPRVKTTTNILTQALSRLIK